MEIKGTDKKEERMVGIGLSTPLTRWWLKSRPCELGEQTEPRILEPCVEFYVPLWAWPFELLHRLIFGKSKLS
jgi:hypothetical protein